MPKGDRYIANTYAANRLTVLYHRQATQPRVIARLLEEEQGAWVCGSAFLLAYLPTYSQRIGELIKDGYPIERGPCDDPNHNHRSTMGHYRIPPRYETQETT